MAFEEGESGNQNGRPVGTKTAKKLAQNHTKEALRVLAEIMQNAENPAADRLTAANSILSRAWGNPAPEAHQQ